MNTISFPRMGIHLNIDPVAFSIGAKPVYWYAICILTGFLLAVLYCTHSAKKQQVSGENVLDIAIYGLIAGIICARIYYVVFDFNAFKNNPLDIFKIWEGGLAIYGGIIGAFISTVIYCRIKKLNTLLLCDVCSPGLLIGQALGRWGNFFNCEVFGGETSLPWGMSINGAAPVHPLFLYESVWNALGFILLMVFQKHKKADGQIFFAYLFWYSFGRLFLEGLRQTQYILYLIPGRIAASQAVALLAMAAASIGFILTHRKAKKS